MKHPPRTFLILVVLVALGLGACERQTATSPAGAQSSPAMSNRHARAAIEAANKAISEAAARGDAAVIGLHYAEDALLLPAGADAVSGRAAIEAHFRRAFEAGLQEFYLEILTVESAGDLAVETGTYQARDAHGNHLDHGKYVVTWRRQDGHWLVYRDISTTSVPGVSTPESTRALAPCEPTTPSSS